MKRKRDPSEDNIHLQIHILHQKMQEWAKILPMQIQQRMSCELLANLAGCLISDTTVFEIVNSLIDIQHIVERDLFNERTLLRNKYSASILNLASEGLSTDVFNARKKELHDAHLRELKLFDRNVILIFDQKITEQQQALESAGVPGFTVCNDPLEIQLQMCLLDFIIRSGRS